MNLFDSVLHTIISIKWKWSSFDGLIKVFSYWIVCSSRFTTINITGMSKNTLKKVSMNIHSVSLGRAISPIFANGHSLISEMTKEGDRGVSK